MQLPQDVRDFVAELFMNAGDVRDEKSGSPQQSDVAPSPSPANYNAVRAMTTVYTLLLYKL
jgi:hypothetical protein